MFTQRKKLSDESFASLKEYFLCANEGEACGYLGIEIKTTDNVLTLKQKKLIKSTIELLKLKDANPRSVPVTSHFWVRALKENAEKKTYSITVQSQVYSMLGWLLKTRRVNGNSSSR